MQPHADDDVYTRSGETYDSTASYAKEPDEQVEEKDQRNAIIAGSYPIMDDVADWFRTQIAASTDIHNVEVTTMTVNGVKYSRKISVEAQVLAFQLLKQLLESKLQEFSGFGKDPDAAE